MFVPSLHSDLSTLLSRLGTLIGALLISLDFKMIDGRQINYFKNEEMTEWGKFNRAFLAYPRAQCLCCCVTARRGKQ